MSNGLKWDFWVNFSMIILICNGFFCLFKMEIWTRRVFSLTRCPIRFNRARKKIYAIRRRRFFSAVQMGNITWEVPWNEDAIFFCIHKGPQNTEHHNTYHIRYYEVDKNGNVVQGFALGREWQDLDGMSHFCTACTSLVLPCIPQ